MADPVTAATVAKFAIPALLNLGGNLLGSRSQERAAKRAAQQAASAQLTNALGNTQPTMMAGQQGRAGSVLADSLKDPVTQQLVAHILSGDKGDGGILGQLMKLFGGSQKINQAARSFGPGQTGGLNWGGPAFSQGGSPNIDWQRLGRGLG